MICRHCPPVAYFLRLRSGVRTHEMLVIGCPHGLPWFKTEIEATCAELADDGGAPVTGVVHHITIGRG